MLAQHSSTQPFPVVRPRGRDRFCGSPAAKQRFSCRRAGELHQCRALCRARHTGSRRHTAIIVDVFEFILTLKPLLHDRAVSRRRGRRSSTRARRTAPSWTACTSASSAPAAPPAAPATGGTRTSTWVPPSCSRPTGEDSVQSRGFRSFNYCSCRCGRSCAITILSPNADHGVHHVAGSCFPTRYSCFGTTCSGMA